MRCAIKKGNRGSIAKRIAKGRKQSVDFVQTLPTLEVLVINLIAEGFCLKRKYSRGFTALVLAAFSAIIVILVFLLAKPLNFQGNGRMMLGGFVYLPVLCFLYQARPLVLFIIMCTCWSYSFGVFSLAFLCSATWFAGDFLCSLGIETALFLLTVVPFYRGIVVKFAFAIENIRACDENWNKYILLTSGLNLVTLAVLHNVLLAENGSVMKICLLLLLLLSTFVANFTLYRIVLDSIKIQHLEKTAASDPLTGLGNRTGLLNHLEALLAGAEPFSVLFMDLDRFKAVNDRYGHLLGDAYLRHFANISAGILAGHGEMYRFGGDEFIALCRGVVPESVVDDLRNCRGWDNDAPCPFRQVSIGILHCEPPHSDGAEAILQKVDQMMYGHKARKKI